MSHRGVLPSRGEVWLADLGLAAKVRSVLVTVYTHFRARLHPDPQPRQG